tara:strand:+ start:10665 stop:11063 length:399 start_codon:yes stop_codon:yes gene_type:complete
MESTKMKITRRQLRGLIVEAVYASSPQAAYDRLKSLEQGNGRYDISIYQRFGLERYADIIRADLERRPQSHIPANQIEEVAEEYEKLSKQFKRVNITTQTDRRYGRKRYAMEHIPSGEQFSLGTDRKGSLGS